MIRTSRIALFAAAVLLPFALPALSQAQEPQPAFDAPTGEASWWDRWDFVVGAGAMFQPEYEGGDSYEIQPIPYIAATYDEWLTLDPTGAKADVYKTGAFTFTLGAGYETGRDEDDADALEGLGDVDMGGVLSARVTADLGPAAVYVGAEKTLGGSDGMLASLGAELGTNATDSLRLGVGAEVIWADDNHMESYFGVNGRQSARSGYDRFDAEAGFKRVDVTASATYSMTEHWFARGEAGVGVLIGDAADSPFVEEELQPSALLALGYRF